MEQALGRGHGHERGDFASATGLTKDEHAPGIAAEVCDVVADPFERGDNVEHAHVGGVGVLRTVVGEVEVAENVEAMVDADHDHVAAVGQAFAVVGWQLLSGAGGVAAAVQPEHDRTLAVVEGGRPDVDAEAILAGLAVVPVEEPRFFVMGPAGARGLRRHLAVSERAADAGPGRGLLRRQEARRACGGGGVGNALEGENPVARRAADLARGGFDHGVIGFSKDAVAGCGRLRGIVGSGGDSARQGAGGGGNHGTLEQVAAREHGFLR